MYYQFFGLSEAPFSIAVNPRYLYMSPRHREALAHLLYGVGAGGGFILLTGEVGTGKTTINRCLLEQLPGSADVAIVLNPALDARDLLATVCEELGIDVAGESPGLKALTDSLHRFLLDNHRRGRKTVLMIDEAQHLDFAVLEQIRLLTNLETNEEKLLHIILIGQPELAEKLARPELRQLNQRITARFNLGPLSVTETSAYIRHRLQVAGLPPGRELFSPSLLGAVHRQSRGIPRLINLLCDRMLLGAYGKNQPRLDRGLLRQAAREALGEDPRGQSHRRWLTLFAAGAMVLVVLAFWLALPDGNESTYLAGEENSKLAASSPDPMDGDGLESLESLGRDKTANDNVEGIQTTEATGPGALEESRRELPATTFRDSPMTLAEEAWRLSPAEGAALLAELYGLKTTTPVSGLCELPLPTDLRCTTGEVQSWEQLLADGRPALLGLVDERRFESRALFVGVEGELAVLGSERGLQRVPLEQVATQWTGTFWQLWRRPLGVDRVLALGDEGGDVRQVAALFALLDGQDEPLASNRFNTRLETRVRLFQQEKNLAADGVLGEQTLRALALAAGIDVDRTQAQAFFNGNEGKGS